MSALSDVQNSTDILRLIAVQNKYYSVSKRIDFINKSIILVLIIVSVIVLHQNNYKEYLLVISLFGFVFNIVLQQMRIEKIVRGATIQEYIDVVIFNELLQQKSFTTNSSIVYIHALSGNYNNTSEAFMDWYEDKQYCSNYEQIFYCQLSNINWSYLMNRLYILFVYIYFLFRIYYNLLYFFLNFLIAIFFVYISFLLISIACYIIGEINFIDFALILVPIMQYVFVLTLNYLKKAALYQNTYIVINRIEQEMNKQHNEFIILQLQILQDFINQARREKFVVPDYFNRIYSKIFD